MDFTKMQAAGNDFILIETGETNQDWPKLAVAMCDRHFGIGGDGLLLVMPSSKVGVRMRLFNADGSEAETCGNGLRCIVRYAVDNRLVDSTASEVPVETLSGIRIGRVKRAGEGIAKVQVGMGRPVLNAGDIPVLIEADQRDTADKTPILDYPVSVSSQEMLLNFASMGNPHAVCFWQHPVADFPLSQLGPEVELHPIFPKRINFEVARVLNRRQIEARVWERGVGETLACGSGACAIAVISRLHGFTDDEVDIILPGGTLTVAWYGVGEVWLSGPAEVVFTGKWLQ
ncbi:diaminopimelate epimerase [Chloroflexota bacterium]